MTNMGSRTIVLDFDGTVVAYEYPNVGRDIGAVPVLKALVNSGHKLVLFTMRSGNKLQDAVDWFKSHDIELYGVQTNPTQKNWTSSPKAYGHLIIDDAALGCPLKTDVDENGVESRAYVDWTKVQSMLLDMEYLR
jgi:predicted HAD superfamily phosphohydrolase YqeG